MNVFSSNSFKREPLLTQPRLPPLFLEPGSIEYLLAKSSKLSPSTILFLIVFKNFIVSFFALSLGVGFINKCLNFTSVGNKGRLSL